jgi:predicted site-specific integrase-resolvase
MDESKEKREYISIKEAVKISGMSFQSIRKYCDAKQIKCFKTPSGGHRRVDKQDLEKFVSFGFIAEEISTIAKDNFIYARVSSKKQLDDLSRQVKYIQERRIEYASYTTLTDIASGINFKRKGIQTILDSCLQGTIGEVVIAHRDRLSRFGFDFFKLIIQKAGGNIIVLDDERNKSTEQELAEDLLSIIHIYSCKQMGKRKYKTSEHFKVIENKVEDNEATENDT